MWAGQCRGEGENGGRSEELTNRKGVGEGKREKGGGGWGEGGKEVKWDE